MDFLSRVLDAVAVHLEIPRARLDDIEYAQRVQDGADRHYIASADAMGQQQRIGEVFKAFRAGCSTAVIAERLGLSQRRVQQIIARNPMP